jgi:hypothetical protein
MGERDGHLFVLGAHAQEESSASFYSKRGALGPFFKVKKEGTFEILHGMDNESLCRPEWARGI